MVLNNIKKRLDILELKHPPPPCSESLEERVAEYERIITTGDYSSEAGQRLRSTIELYSNAIEEVEQ